jgi:hypothetical protein
LALFGFKLLFLVIGLDGIRRILNMKFMGHPSDLIYIRLEQQAIEIEKLKNRVAELEHKLGLDYKVNSIPPKEISLHTH